MTVAEVRAEATRPAPAPTSRDLVSAAEARLRARIASWDEARRRGLMHNLQLKTVAEYPLLGADGNSVILKIWPKNIPER